MTPKDTIIEIFFSTQSGKLPQEYVPLQKQYLKEKESLFGCQSCNLNGLIRQYRNKIIAGKLD